MDNNILRTQIPSAIFIEMARDSLQLEQNKENSQKKLHELEVASGTRSDDYQLGFLLGLKTSEICLELSFQEERLHVKKEEK